MMCYFIINVPSECHVYKSNVIMIQLNHVHAHFPCVLCMVLTYCRPVPHASSIPVPYASCKHVPYANVDMYRMRHVYLYHMRPVDLYRMRPVYRYRMRPVDMYRMRM